MPARTLSADLTLGPTTAAYARRLTRLVLEQWGVVCEDVVAATVLVVSELVTNAERHCGAHEGAALELALSDAGIRVAVVDCSPDVPRPRTALDDDESGRGLQLVSELSATWGVEPHASGKRVFAVVPVPQTACA